MKLLLVIGTLLVFVCATSSGAEESMGFDPKKDRSNVPWNAEHYKYAVERTKEVVMKKLREELEPKELKNATLKASLSKDKLKSIQDRFENTFNYEKETLEKHLESSMESHKDIIGRLTKAEIEESAKMLVKDFGKGHEDFQPPKQEL